MLLDKLKSVPNSPGVYQYFDENNKLLYIGKAKNLKNRIKSYFKFTPVLSPANNLSPRIKKMVSEVYDLEYIIVDSEYDALILENSLIKQLKPKYNILLRDDKTYPYFYIDYSSKYPRIEITRKIVKSQNIKYFGPFAIASREILDSIYELLPLVQRKNYKSYKKVCLFYQLKRCLGPCEYKVSKEEYQQILDEAIQLILDKSKLIEKLKEKMLFYADILEFEKAKELRDRINIIEKSIIKSNVDLLNLDDFDVIGIRIFDKKAIVVKLFIRQGKIISSDYDILKLNNNIELEELYRRVIIDFYNKNLILSKVVVIDDINKDDLEEFLRIKFNKKIPIIYPKRGPKKNLANIVLKNIEELSKKEIDNKILFDIKELFNLEEVPYRIEVFDNSHLFKQARVGAMVVWEDKFIKSDYRYYNLQATDEYSQMKELLSRRIDSFEKNPPPNLWVIDGGETLLKLAYKLIKEKKVNLDIIAISKEKIDYKTKRAKGSAKDILYSKDNIFKLVSSDKRLLFIQKLRDEAHKMAINFHKKQKLKEDKQISLLNIHGIAEAKVKKLINYFGLFENIKKASLDELENVLNKKDAMKVFEFFQS